MSDYEQGDWVYDEWSGQVCRVIDELWGNRYSLEQPDGPLMERPAGALREVTEEEIPDG